MADGRQKTPISPEQGDTFHSRLNRLYLKIASREASLRESMVVNGVSEVPSGFVMKQVGIHMPYGLVAYSKCIIHPAYSRGFVFTAELVGQRVNDNGELEASVSTKFFQTSDGGYRLTYHEIDSTTAYTSRCPVLHVLPNGTVAGYEYVGMREMPVLEDDYTVILNEVLATLTDYFEPNSQS